MTRGEDFLVAEKLAKRFGDTRALVSCSFDIRLGEVHALIGENGSGKSTLVKVLSGVLGPDHGSLAVRGSTLSQITSPRHASRLGVATVFQEILAVEDLSVLDTIWLGFDGIFRRRLSPPEKQARAGEVLARLTPSYPSLDTPMSRLALGQRQLAVIARALVREPRLLILDEATAALDIADRNRLFDEIRQRCGADTAVLFISHRMDELSEIADRVTVLRSGDSVATLPREEAETTTLLRLMSGREPETMTMARGARHDRQDSAVVLQATGMVLRTRAPAVDFELRAGEIVGLAGLEGHGQDEFARGISGVTRPAAGRVLVEPGGRLVGSIDDATQADVTYVPRDRRSEGIFEPLSVIENFAMPTLRRDRRRGVLSRRLMRKRFAAYREQLRIRLTNELDLITTLSGGNQQKVIIACRLASEPRVLVLNDPTRGVDPGTKQDIYRLLVKLCDDGVAVVLLSSDLEEHILLVDRVLVFREGTVSAELAHEQLSRATLLAALFGEEPEYAPARSGKVAKRGETNPDAIPDGLSK
jgi:ABC-type sugar transport system ATPase subunit